MTATQEHPDLAIYGSVTNTGAPGQGQDSRGQDGHEIQLSFAPAPSSEPAKVAPLTANGAAPVRNPSPPAPTICGSAPTPSTSALVDLITPEPANDAPLTANGAAPVRDTPPPPVPTMHQALTMPCPSALVEDKALGLLATGLDDIEAITIATENRIRQLTGIDPKTGKPVEWKDGEARDFGLDESNPAVRDMTAFYNGLKALNDAASKSLQRRMRKHPLWPAIEPMAGVGAQQAARLLAVVRDPYWNHYDDQPRTVSQLWRWCGLDPVDGAARRRRRGEVANWSSEAKSRAWLIAESCKRGLRKPCLSDPDTGYATHVEGCVCYPLRVRYDQRKAATVGRLHRQDCIRCGPKGKPALAGSQWSRAHREADALRIVSKEILKLLWRASRDVHNERHSQ